MIVWLWSVLTVAYAVPVVVTLDNGGFNLPLYTERWTGTFEQPSVARQVVADIARMQGVSPRVFTYLPPGRQAGSSSTPTEVLPTRRGCTGDACACAPGDNCWAGIDVNRSPTASTSLFQAAIGVRKQTQGPRIEVHFTDLFEEDPSTVQKVTDADRCVTSASTRKALEAVLSAPGGSLDHIAVGRLTASIDPPKRAAGSVVGFRQSSAACWEGRRLRKLGGDRRPVAFDMAVIVLGIDTAASDDQVQQFLRGLPRQLSDPLQLTLVTVREPATIGLMAPQYLRAQQAELILPPALPRSTPCNAVHTETRLWSGGQPINAQVEAGCSEAGRLLIPPEVLSASFRHQAGLNPFVGSMEVGGEVVITGDLEAARAAVEALSDNPSRDRALPHWGALVDALRFDGSDTVARPRKHRVQIEQVIITNADDRPWLLSIVFSLLPFAIVVGGTYLLLARIAGSRAFRRHLEAGSAQGRPVAAVLVEAAEEARGGWFGRLMFSLALGTVVAFICMMSILVLDGVRGG